jgi:hypothetical protein
MKESGQMLGIQTLVSTLGINGVAGMMIFGTQRFLVTLPENIKFVLFWAGLIVAALVTTYAVFRLMYHKSVNYWIVGGVAALGLMVMVLMSPIMPYIFPYNPLEMSMSGNLQAGGDLGFPTLAVFVGGIALLAGLILGQDWKD